MTCAARAFLGVFALLCSIAAYAAPYPTEAELRRAIQDVVHYAQAQDMQVEILDARKEGVTRPLMAAGLSLKTGNCLVFFNTKPLEELQQFFLRMDTRDMPLWLDGIAVHELTHCIEQREAYIRERFDKVLPPGMTRENVTVQSYLAVVKSGAVEVWGEALADITAVLFFREVVPEDWKRFADSLAAMREGFAQKFPAHDTSPWLRRVIAAGAKPAANQSLFEAAFQLRKQYAPEK